MKPPMPNTTLPPSSPPAEVARALGWAGAALLAGVLLAGCHGPLLSAQPAVALLETAPGAREHRAALDADVRRLAHTDFIVRAQASERLLAAGQGALPALGRVGDQPVLVYGRERLSTTRPVIDAILGGLPDRVVRDELLHGEPVVRRAAAEALGQRGRWGAVAGLIEATEDEAQAVRAAAAASLRRLTNRFFGYEADAVPTLRAQATERWRTWWAIEGRVQAGATVDDEG